MAKKVIRGNLSSKGMQDIINQIGLYKTSLHQKAELLCQRLAGEGLTVSESKIGESPLGKYVSVRIDLEPSKVGCRVVLIAMGQTKTSTWQTKDGVKSAMISCLAMVEFGSGIAMNPIVNPLAEKRKELNMSGINDLYGVLKGKVIGYDEGDARKDPYSPHVYIYVEANKIKYKIAVNTKSAPKKPIIINGDKVPNELLFITNAKFNSLKITHLQDLEYGFYPIKYHNKYVYSESDYPGNLDINYPDNKYNPEDIAVDFIRSKLFNPCDMSILPSDKIGPDNDLADFFQEHLGEKAINTEANIYVYGGHFDNGKGIHEVHMNQGSIGTYEKYNGVYQDGCILLEFTDNHWEAIFLAFQSQSWDTNQETGNSESNLFLFDHKTGKKICKINSF